MRMRHPGMPGQVHHRRFNHIRRIDRGGFVPGFWFGPQFHIQNWGMYGFSQPSDGGRWVRYYDDAYMIDRDGRVRDSRHDMDWDRYGERWDYDDNGVPVYAGDGDYEPDDRDYEWAERNERGDHGRDDYARGPQDRDDRGYGHGYGRQGPPMPPPGYGCGGCGGAYGGHGGYGYGYGWGYGWGPVIVTETTVTTAPVVEMRTYYETVRVAPRKVRRCRCAAPAPRPRPGERG
jgi:hypothetical protein